MRPALHEFDFDMTEQFRVVAGIAGERRPGNRAMTEANSTRVTCHLHLGDMQRR